MKLRHLLLMLSGLLLATPLAAQLTATSRISALNSAKNLRLTTNDGTAYYYLVSSNDIQTLRFEGSNVSIGNDHFAIADIQSMRFHALPHFIFDEDSTTYDNTLAVDHGLVALRRSFVLNQWNSLVLPLSLTTEQIIDAFGEGTQVPTPRGVSENGDVAVELQTLAMEPGATVIQANYHYLIRPTREPDLEEGKQFISFISGRKLMGPVYVIPNVSLKAKSSPRTEPFPLSDGLAKVRFKGTYKKLDDSVVEGQYIRNQRIAAGTYMLNEEGVMQQNTEATEVRAFCSWVDEIGGTHDLTFYLDGERLTPDAIADLRQEASDAAAADQGIYDLGGRRVGTLPLSGAALRPGIYVIQGRKVVVK